MSNGFPGTESPRNTTINRVFPSYFISFLVSSQHPRSATVRTSYIIVILSLLIFLASSGTKQDEHYEVIVLQSGDTLQTNQTSPLRKRIVPTDSILPPKHLQLSAPEIKKAHSNSTRATNGLPIPIQITKFTGDKRSKNYEITNDLGQKIETGKAKKLGFNKAGHLGKIIPQVLQKSSRALPPRFRDNVQYNIKYLDVDQGLKSSYVYAIHKDRRGILWLGTYNGLCKYDGNSFTYFSENEGLSANNITCITEDHHGNLWMGTDGGGAMYYDGKNFYHLNQDNGLSSNVVLSITEDHQGNIWMGTGGAGVCLIQGDKMTSYGPSEGVPGELVWDIHEDQQQRIWFATENGLGRYENGLFYSIKGLESEIWSIAEDSITHRLWFGTAERGLLCYDRGKMTQYGPDQGLVALHIKNVQCDPSGHVWMGTYNEGMVQFDGRTFTQFSKDQGLTYSTVRTIFPDDDGNIWIGTSGGGLVNYRPQSFEHFTSNEGLIEDVILSMLEDRKGNLWLASYGGGFSYRDSENFYHYTSDQNFPADVVISLYEDRSGNIWIGTEGDGVIKYDGKDFFQYTTSNGLASNSVRIIHEDRKGNFWFGSYGGGITLLQEGKFFHITEEEGLSSNIIMDMLEDKQGRIWLATLGGGLSKIEDMQITHFTDKEGLSMNQATCLMEDQQGNIWVGTYGGGISIFDGHKFRSYSEKEGLGNNIVWSIQEDALGRIWMGTESGLSCFYPSNMLNQDSKEPYQIMALNKLDGLKGIDFYSNSSFIDSKQQLWLGSGKCLSKINLQKFSIQAKKPGIQLDRIDINEHFIQYDRLSEKQKDSSDFYKQIGLNSTEPFSNYPKGLQLPYDLNHLTFHFHASDWQAPHQIRYSYKIDELNQSWSQLSDEAKADYRNIPYGQYTFRVKAIGQAGCWSREFVYHFEILPPWWHTSWFRVLLVLLSILILFQFFRWRTAKLRSRQQELQQEVALATTELRSKNTEIELQKEAVEQAHAQLAYQHQEIKDSINYAKRIQEALLAEKEHTSPHLPEHFVLYEPKDVVSGDYYWVLEKSEWKEGQRHDYLYVCVADCTGHGVPGAFMSLLGISFLNEINSREHLLNPGEILNELRKRIIKELKQTGSIGENKDGIDLSLLRLKLHPKGEKTEAMWAGANNPLYIIRKGLQDVGVKGISDERSGLMVIPASKQPIGYSRNMQDFENHVLQLQSDDVLILFSDGYADQFGGPKGKKFKYQSFKELLLKINEKPMNEQAKILLAEFENWKGELEQVDDICVIGMRI
ncbi:MAG: hypothetical protein EP338_08490 [Bacteroidetes bacterium]|nr:MAG: hypothetical protein EP338_08490 [Bacteroidota bacterium]